MKDPVLESLARQAIAILGSNDDVLYVVLVERRSTTDAGVTLSNVIPEGAIDMLEIAIESLRRRLEQDGDVKPLASH